MGDVENPITPNLFDNKAKQLREETQEEGFMNTTNAQC